MGLYKGLMLLAPLLLNVAAASLFADDGKVSVVDDLPNFLAAHPRSLVMFFAPWDEQSVSAAGPFTRVAEDTDVEAGVVAAVDCTKSRKACKSQKIRGFPVIKLFDAGQVHVFSGPRLHADLLAFFQNPTGTATRGPADALASPNSKVQVLADTELKAFIAEGPTLVLFHADWSFTSKV